MKASLAASLDQLETLGLIRQTDIADLSFSFKHTLAQEVVYQSLLMRHRRQVHGLIAEALESLYPDRLDEFASLLAQHYDRAGNDAKTLEFACRAGEVSARVYAQAEAFAHYSHALEIALRSTVAPGSPLLADLYLKCGRALELADRFQDALTWYLEMEREAVARGDQALKLEALMAQATLHSILGPVHDPPQARALAAQALALAQEMHDRKAEAKIYWNLMLLETYAGNNAEIGIPYGEKSLAIARELGLIDQQAYTTHDLAMAHFLSGHTERAVALQKQALARWQEANIKAMYAEGLDRLGLINFMHGKFEESRVNAEEALDVSQAIANASGEGLSSYLLSRVDWELGDSDTAIARGLNGIRIAEHVGIGRFVLSVYAHLAWVYGSLGDVGSGLSILQRGMEQADVLLSRNSQREAELALSLMRSAQVRLELLRGNRDAAQEIVSVAPLEPGEYYSGLRFPDLPMVFLADAELALARQDYTLALTIVERMLVHVGQLGVRPFAADALYMKGKIHLEQGQEADALREWNAAKSIANESGSRRMLLPILVSLGMLEQRRAHPEQAREYFAQASDIITHIRHHLPGELSAAFMDLPLVRVALDPDSALVKERTE